MATTEEILEQLRRPKVLITNAYLNDEIQTELDERLHPETLLQQVEELDVVQRDGVNYAIVELSLTGSVYPIEMNSPRYSAEAVRRYINKDFKEY